MPDCPADPTSDHDLVRRAQAGDQHAFAELIQQTASPSMKLALSILKDRQDAEDQVQNSVLKAWRAIQTFQFESKFSTWFRTIVFNQSLMRLRSIRRVSVRSLDDAGTDGQRYEPADSAPSPEASLRRRQMAEHLKTEMARLPPVLREVLVLREVEELTGAAIAERLGISEPAVKSRLLRARKMLRDRMDRHVGGTSVFQF